MMLPSPFKERPKEPPHDIPMTQKKICMLGSYAVGKTSLVKRFIEGIFSEKYKTTIGVKIDKKQIMLDDEEVNLILWDLNGQDRFQQVAMSYLRGSAGYLLVADGTRQETLDLALSLHERAQDSIGQVPFMLLINKQDLTSEWELDADTLDDLRDRDIRLLLTSAKTGQGVEEAFHTLARQVVSS